MNPIDPPRTAWGTAETLDSAADDSIAPPADTSAPSAFQDWEDERHADDTQYNTQQPPAVLEPPVHDLGPRLPRLGGVAHGPSQHDSDVGAHYLAASPGTQQWGGAHRHSSFQGPAGLDTGGGPSTHGEQIQPEQTHPAVPRLAELGPPSTGQPSDLPPAGHFGPHTGVSVEDRTLWPPGAGFQEVWSPTPWSDTAQAVPGQGGLRLGGTDTALDNELGGSGSQLGTTGGGSSVNIRLQARYPCSRCRRSPKDCDRTLSGCGACRKRGIECSYHVGAKATKYEYDWNSRQWEAI